jgi:maleylacetoacetate isomerase
VLKLYSFHSSSAAYRARIALNLKGVAYEIVPVDLIGEAKTKGGPYDDINPQRLVPALATDQGLIPQSLAIMGYLDGVYPEPPFMPKDPWGRAMIMAIACNIACDVHPVNNLRIRLYLKDPLGHTDNEVAAWQRHWIEETFEGLETFVKGTRGDFCYGDTPTVADICLVPQMTNARRVHTDLKPFPNLVEIDERARAHPAFAAAAPDKQPDYPRR